MPAIKWEDTICAIATASGEAALSIVRLSGPKAFSIADRIFRAKSGRLLKDAKAFTLHYGHVIENGEAIDECLVGVFRRPKSFTAEDMAEFSTHGGTQAAKKLIELCCESGARVAEPGEFTQRAFLNGRIDLTQAEAVIDIIRSSGEKSLKQAVRQLEGQLSERLKLFKQKLLLVLAHIEAYIDFPEDDHDVYSNRKFKTEIEELTNDLKSLLGSYESGLVIRNGLLCAIVGKPNVGKSSLLNALLGKDRAIVTHIPGTTRDTLEESIVWDGVSVRLVDTAGLGKPRDELDKMGMDRTRKYLDQADFYVWVIDGSKPLSEEDFSVGKSVAGKPFVAAVNKSDLPRQVDSNVLEKQFNSAPFVFCSAVRGSGLDEIRKKVLEHVLRREVQSENVHLTRERHHASVADAVTHLERAQKSFSEKASLEFLAGDLRTALQSLSELIGEVYSDDLLEVIFREFCIGK